MPFDVEGARKAGYTDTEIADHLAGQNKFDTKGARSAGYTDTDIIKHLQEANAPSAAVDVGKQVLAAVPSALEDVATFPAKVANLAAPVGNWLGRGAEAIGLGKPDPQSVDNRDKLLQLIAASGGSGGIRQYLPEPQTTPGKYARTGTEFAGSALLGMPGRGVGRLATDAAIGAGAGLTSEGAGQLAEKYVPELEPAARIGGALFGGGVGAIAPNALARRANSALVPTAENLGASGSAKFEAVKNLGVTLDPTTVSKGLGGIKTKLAEDFGGAKELDNVVGMLSSAQVKAAPEAPGALAALTGVKPKAKAPVNIDELQTLRSQLGKAGLSNDAMTRQIAQDAQSHLDDFIGNIKPEQVLSGDATKAVDLLKSARGDWAAQRRAQTVAGRIELGDLNTDTMTTGNPNAGRQAIKSVLRPDMNGRTQASRRGFDRPEQDFMRNIVGGNTLGNALRFIGGNALVPGSAAGAGIGAAIATGDPRYLALAGAGYGARRLAGAVTKRQERLLDEMVRSRSPLARDTYRITPPVTRLTTGATGTLLGLRPGMNPLLQPPDEGEAP